MKTATILLTLILLGGGVGCSLGGADSTRPALTPADPVGHYGQSGHIGYLELRATGEYECFIVNGMTADGCGTFVGAGISRGSWHYQDGSVSFLALNEPADLVLSLAGASAVPSETGLLLTVQGEEHLLAREEVQTRPAQGTDANE